MCYSTMVLEPKYDHLEGVEYFRVETATGTYAFAQDRPGVLPSLLGDLSEFRKKAKKDMADAKARGDEWAVALHNGKQLAYKVTMNSVYGFCGATRGMLPCVPIASSVTATGRGMIRRTQELVLELAPGSRVVYGDSVAAHTPVIVRRTGRVDIVEIDRLVPDDGWVACADGKDIAAIEADVWSESGWSRVHSVVRHRVAKPMYRVSTRLGVVDVTADHSLLRADATPVGARDVRTGDALLHFEAFPAFAHPDPLTDPMEARIMGCLIGDGAGVPPRVLAADPEVRLAFWRGMCTDRLPARVAQKSAKAAATVGALAESLGHSAEYSFGNGVYEVQTVQGEGGGEADDPAARDPGARDHGGSAATTSIVRLPDREAYVYDLTTSTHHFAAGVGRLVVHNTDSVLVILKVPEDKRHDVRTHAELAVDVASKITATFRQPNELEVEKFYWPFMLFAKKRYVGEWVKVKVKVVGLAADGRQKNVAIPS